MKKQSSSRKQFIGLILIFAIPTIAAWFFIYNPEFLPSSRANKGELVHPQITIKPFEFKSISNNTITSKGSYKDYWTFIVIAGDSCDNVCRQRIHDMRQVRKALEEDYIRVKRLVVVSSNEADESLVSYLKPYHGTDVILQNKGVAENIINALGGGSDIINNLFVMDPMQNVMMYYTPQHSAKDLLTDMKRLLKINQWGAGH